MGRFGRGSFVAGMLLLFGMIASSTAQAPVEPLGPERRAEAKLSCDGGDLQACFLFGRDLANQQAATSEGDEIIHNVLGKACLGGVFEACYGFGNYKLIGVGADMDEAEARKMFDRGCQGGDAKSCQALQRFDAAPLNAARLSKAEWPLRRRINAAVYIIDDKGKMLNELASFETFSRDNILAAKMRETACDMGNPEACWVAARYMLGMDEHPYFLQRGVRYADRACMGGEAKGCKLRDSFQDKKLTPMGNPAKWGSIAYTPSTDILPYMNACATDEPFGCERLEGNLRDDYKCQTGDPEFCSGIKQIAKYEADCAGGVGKACDSAGDNYLKLGRITIGEVQLAIDFYDRACNLQYQESCGSAQFFRNSIAKGIYDQYRYARSPEQVEMDRLAEVEKRKPQELADRFNRAGPSDEAGIAKCNAVFSKFNDEISSFNRAGERIVADRDNVALLWDKSRNVRRYYELSVGTCNRLVDLAQEAGNLQCPGPMYSTMISKIPQLESITSADACGKRAMELGASFNYRR